MEMILLKIVLEVLVVAFFKVFLEKRFKKAVKELVEYLKLKVAKRLE